MSDLKKQDFVEVEAKIDAKNDSLKKKRFVLKLVLAANVVAITALAVLFVYFQSLATKTVPQPSNTANEVPKTEPAVQETVTTAVSQQNNSSEPAEFLLEDVPDETNAKAVSEAPPEPEPRKISKEIADLRSEYGNDDIVGYITIEGTSVDYPIVQAEDNAFYLKRNIKKEEDAAGWIFLDYENDLGAINRNTIIYGHNMKRDIMFHAIRYYRDESFYKKHPRISVKTIYENTEWEVFSFMKTHVSLNYLEVEPSDEDYKYLLDEIRRQRFYDTGVEFGLNDKIINLSTCSVYKSEDMYRYVLSAKLVSREDAKVQ
ncbi:MAG: class B sortase [Clostridiales bacterium]|nr:class B sortase [Clostridiales bacterium]